MAMHYKFYISVIILLVLFFGVLILMEMQALNVITNSQDGMESQLQGRNLYNVDESKDEEYGVTSKLVNKFIQTRTRPLLVRFNWYSRKQTPVHIG